MTSAKLYSDQKGVNIEQKKQKPTIKVEEVKWSFLRLPNITLIEEVVKRFGFTDFGKPMGVLRSFLYGSFILVLCLTSIRLFSCDTYEINVKPLWKISEVKKGF